MAVLLWVGYVAGVILWAAWFAGGFSPGTVHLIASFTFLLAWGSFHHAKQDPENRLYMVAALLWLVPMLVWGIIYLPL